MRVVFFGDSNTYGFDPRDPFDDRYPASVRWTDRLQRMLDAAYAGTEATRQPDADIPEHWTVISRGQNGRCVPVMPQMSGYIQSMIREVWPVDRFAVMLGTNDLLLTHHPDAALPAAQMRQFLLFLRMKYPETTVPLKQPMPRPVDEYFANWEGPTRTEFRDDIDITKYNGNQKWLLYCLERFLNNYDK